MEEAPPTKNTASIHQIVAGDQVIYEGADWIRAFLDAGHHPSYRDKEIVHLYDGKTGVRWLPVVIPDWQNGYLPAGIEDESSIYTSIEEREKKSFPH